MRQFPALLERKSGTLHVSADAVEFVPDPGSNGRGLRIPTSDLQLGMAGENTPFYLLHRSGAPEPAISVTDQEVLRILSSFGVRGATAILQRAGRRRTRRRWLIGSFAGVTVLIALGIPFLISQAPLAFIDRLVSPGAERQIGRVLSESFDMNSAGAPGTRELRQLVELLQTSSAELRDLELDVRVSPDSEVNAYAMPGGIMAVNVGLIRQAESIEEILAVMAHELGHIRQRHALRNMTSNLGFSAGAALLGLFVGTDAMLWVFKGGNLALLANSREAEREADQLALTYLRNAHVSPRGAVAFFDRMRAHELSGQVGTALSMLGTHPLSEERVQALKDLIAAHPHRADARIPVTLKQLQAAIR
jgi:beta-barrel assembly-enhancing protease